MRANRQHNLFQTKSLIGIYTYRQRPNASVKTTRDNAKPVAMQGAKVEVPRGRGLNKRVTDGDYLTVTQGSLFSNEQ